MKTLSCLSGQVSNLVQVDILDNLEYKGVAVTRKGKKKFVVEVMFWEEHHGREVPHITVSTVVAGDVKGARKKALSSIPYWMTPIVLETKEV